MKCPRCQHDNPVQAKFCLACGGPARASESGPPGASYADVQSALIEALEEQTATAEVLRIISSSPADLEPVFRALLVRAARLCGADNGGIFTFHDGALHLAASYNLSPEFRAFLESTAIQPGPGGALRRAALERQPVQNPDALADTNLPAAALEAYRREGMRTAIAVPMLKENTLVGAIAFHRREIRPFSDKQTALLKTFADQAVIAIENVRLFKELEEKNQALTSAHAQVTEALDRQSATSEILRVISRSSTDVQPVFTAIADSAARLCEAFDAIVLRVDGDALRLVAHYGPMPAGDVPLHRGTLGGRTVMERRLLHIEDLQAQGQEFPEGSAIAHQRGHRTTLSVPLLRDGVAIGNIQLRRNEVRRHRRRGKAPGWAWPSRESSSSSTMAGSGLRARWAWVPPSPSRFRSRGAIESREDLVRRDADQAIE